MTHVTCDHCEREYEPPNEGEYNLVVIGKNNKRYELSVIPFDDDGDSESTDLCIDCMTYLMSHV